MAITDLQAHLISSGTSEDGVNGDGLADRLSALEAEFHMLREECVRMRKLIEDREAKGRTVMDAYKQVISDFTNLFEAQRKESLKREESIRFLLSSVESRINSRIERIVPKDREIAQTGSWNLFRRR